MGKNSHITSDSHLSSEKYKCPAESQQIQRKPDGGNTNCKRLQQELQRSKPIEVPMQSCHNLLFMKDH